MDNGNENKDDVNVQKNWIAKSMFLMCANDTVAAISNLSDSYHYTIKTYPDTDTFNITVCHNYEQGISGPMMRRILAIDTEAFLYWIDTDENNRTMLHYHYRYVILND